MLVLILMAFWEKLAERAAKAALKKGGDVARGAVKKVESALFGERGGSGEKSENERATKDGTAEVPLEGKARDAQVFFDEQRRRKKACKE